MKKIFVMAKKMESGGTEVALLNLLNELVKDKNNDITLGLLSMQGMYIQDIPKQVKVVEVLNKEQLACLEKMTIKNINFKILKFKIACKLLRKRPLEKYLKILQEVQQQEDTYDIAIDFHGYGYIGTVYVIEKINARKKIIFVHDEKIDWIDKIEAYMDKYDKIYCVSEACKKRIIERYLKYKKNIDVFRNIIPRGKIIELSKENINEMKDTCLKLLTVGRIEYQKGYDLLLDIAQVLKNKNLQFKWYIIGGGTLYEIINKRILEMGLSSNVILLGTKKNPYPYMAKCNIYIQPSRHEGYGIAIAEARVLEKPIIATNLDCIREQIVNGKNGLLCEFDKNDFYNAIIKLINDEELKESLVGNLKKDNQESTNDIKKLLEV